MADTISTNIRAAVEGTLTDVQQGALTLRSLGRSKYCEVKGRCGDRFVAVRSRWGAMKVRVLDSYMVLKMESGVFMEDVKERIGDKTEATKIGMEETFDKIDDSFEALKLKTKEMVENLKWDFKSKSEDVVEEMTCVGEHIEVTCETSREMIIDLSDNLGDNISSLKRNFRDFSLHEKFCDAIESDIISENLCTCRSGGTESLKDFEDITAISQVSESVEESFDAVSSELTEISYELRSKLL